MAKDKSDILSILKKKYGEGVCKSAKGVVDYEPQILRISPSMNCLLNGGIPEGSWINIAGRKKIGKTVLALTIAREALKMGKQVFYLNVEGRLKKMNLEGINGLEYDKMLVIGSTEDEILSAQKYLQIAEDILLHESGVVLIIDSIAALVNEKELTEGVGTNTMGGNQKLVSQFCNQMSNVVPVRKHIVVSIQRMGVNLGYGAKWVVKGGNDIGYQGDIILIEKGKTDWVIGSGQDAKVIGHKVKWECECSALGTLPNSTIEMAVRYGYGIDNIEELISLGTDYGCIEKSGSWYYLDFLENHLDIINETEWNDAVRGKWKAQGTDNIGNILRDNPKIVEMLEKNISSKINA